MAAGLGFKTFTTGEVLTAADTNGYLMQGVLVFASSAARASAVTSPQEGQYSYLKDTNSTEYYDGAAWIAAPIGDITGVTAGTGISGGGTSGTVTITNSMATEITAKGDLIAGTGSATFDNLPVGTNGQVLTADSTVSPTGLKWATPTSSSFATGHNYVTTSGATTSTSFVDLTTAQSVTVTTGTKALVILKSNISNVASYANIGGTLSVAVSGATTLAANNENSVGLTVYAPSTNGNFNFRGTILLTGLTAGSNVFTIKFKDENGSTSTFNNRSISVIDLGS